MLKIILKLPTSSGKLVMALPLTQVPNQKTKALTRILLVAGEASADSHGASVVAQLLKRNPNAEIHGMGGSKLRLAGMNTIVDSEHCASVMGFSELLGSAKNIYTSFKTIERSIKRQPPDLAILIDYPDFNLRLAKVLKKSGVKVLYYISPQLWAWRQGRIKIIKRYVDKIACIFPFEQDFYGGHQVDAEYVGHPFLDEHKSAKSYQDIFLSSGIELSLPIVALLPGSRKAEIKRHLPTMIEAFLKVRSYRPGIQGVIPVAATLNKEWIESFVPKSSGLFVVNGDTREIFNGATIAVVKSGTTTLEAALSRIPFFVIYRASKFSYFIAKKLVKGVKFIGMVNLVAGRKIVNELIQDDVTVDNIAEQMELLLGNSKQCEELKTQLAIIKERLARLDSPEKNCAERVAEIALNMVASERA
jgi:lipid-A-disaccharide synthase